MISKIPFKAEHGLLLKEAGAFPDSYLDSVATIDSFKAWESNPVYSVYSIINTNGVILAVGGAIKYWANRIEVFAIFHPLACKVYFLQIFKLIKKFILELNSNRIEAVVESNFKNGNRLVKILGFEVEAPLMKKYGLSGEDYTLYARIKK